MDTKKISLKKIYQQAIKSGNLHKDAQQYAVVMQLDNLWKNINNKKGLMRRLFFKFYKKTPLVPQGIYLWGPVGVGKSMLIDMLFTQIDKKLTRRFHFHSFMSWVQQNLLQVQGQKNPLALIFKTHFSGLKLLFLDEFLVEDATEALILKQVLEALRLHGVCFVTTSNTAPDDLYQGGMYRERFLPAIALIKQHNHVLQIDTSPDYRSTKTAAVDKHYFFPCSTKNKELFRQRFLDVAKDVCQVHKVTLFNRDITVMAGAGKAIWFEFKIICGVPRAAKDYMTLATQYDYIFISDMPQLGEKNTVWIINFIYLIDILYEKRIKLFILAEVPMKSLYPKGKHADEFSRALSRLVHMQSSDW